jgi:hypothetical protein
MKAMKLALAACLVLVILACTDPFSFEPGDPTKPNPPSSPELIQPGNGWMSDDYIYPQNVTLGWQKVPGAQFYQVEAYRDSLLRSQYLVHANQRVAQPPLTVPFSGFGLYYWRVRAASRNWNNYTNWSAPFRFSLPNPAR